MDIWCKLGLPHINVSSCCCTIYVCMSVIKNKTWPFAWPWLLEGNYNGFGADPEFFSVNYPGSTFSKNLTNLKAGQLQGERLAGNYWSLSLHFLLKAAIFYAFPCILASKTLTNIFAWWFNESPFSSADFLYFKITVCDPLLLLEISNYMKKTNNCSQKAT